MKKFTLIYLFLLLSDLISRMIQPNWPMAEYIFKPSLMVSLGIYFISNTILRGRRANQYVLAAIIFSLLGDIFLMFKGYFVMGLGSFLIAHIFYICAFGREAMRFFSKRELYIPSVLVLIYGVFLLSVVLPNVSSALKLPIFIYSLTILTMLLTTLHRLGNVPSKSFWYVVIGAVLFVISDSMIAISEFVSQFSMAGILIMVTYGIGQYLIIEGFLERSQTTQNMNG